MTITTDDLPMGSAIARLVGELDRRHARLTASMSSRGFACIVATRPESITYLTGYTSTTLTNYVRPIVALLTADARLIVLVPETEHDAAAAAIPGAEFVAYRGMSRVHQSEVFPDGTLQFAPLVIDELTTILKEVGDGWIAVDGLHAAWPPMPRLVERCDGVNGRLRDASTVLWDARLHKSPWEIDRMRRAGRVLNHAHRLTRTRIEPGMTEDAIGKVFAQAQLEAGADLVGPMGVVAGTERGLFGTPSAKVWRDDQLLYLDGTTCVGGYWADFCRTYAPHRPTQVETDGYAKVIDGLEAALLASEPGLRLSVIGAAMADAMRIDPRDVGFGRFGHGIGLWVPEPPSLHPDETTRIDVGMTVCIEPAARHAGLNFVAEAGYTMTPQGFELITPAAPTTILEL